MADRRQCNAARLQLPRLHELDEEAVGVAGADDTGGVEGGIGFGKELDAVLLKVGDGLLDVLDEQGEPIHARRKLSGKRGRRGVDFGQLDQRVASFHPHLAKAARGKADVLGQLVGDVNLEGDLQAQDLMVEVERFFEVAADDGDVDDRMDQLDHGSTVFCRAAADTPPLLVNETFLA